MCDGESATRMPASSSAARFDSAVPAPPRDDRPGVAHAPSGRRGAPGDEGRHRLADLAGA